MSKIIRFFSVIVTLVLTLFVLAMCSPIKVSNGESTAASRTGENTGDYKKGGPSWSWDTTPIRLNWYIDAGWYDKKWDAQNTLVDRIITQKTGVDINIIIPSGNGNEKLTIMASSNKLPDIITIDNWNSIHKLMTKAGKFQPLNDLAAKYAPDLLQYYPESIRNWYTEKDGNWYRIANFITAPEWFTKDTYIENNNGIIARKDIMDRLGIKPEDFTTQDGTVEALKKVKEAKLLFKGKSIQPFYFQWNDWAMSRMWGIPWETLEGDWQDYRTHPKYLEMYKFLNRLWCEELLPKDIFTAWAGEKISEGVCFAYMGNLDIIKNAMSDVYKSFNSAVYIPVGPIHALDGAAPLYDQAGTGWTSTFITINSQKPDRAIRLLAFLASDEGQMITWYGIEGKTYNIVNGKVRFTDEYMRLKNRDPKMAETVYGVDTFWPLKQGMFDQKLIDYEAMSQEDRNYCDIKKYFAQFSVRTPETMDIWPEPGTEEAGIGKKIDEYWARQVVRMVMAKSEEQVEQIYEESLKYINDIGYNRVYQATNARFQAFKLKAGKKFSYPGYMK